MKEYEVTITTTFTKKVVVKADNEESAVALVSQEVESGDIDGTETTDFDTTYDAEEK